MAYIGKSTLVSTAITPTGDVSATDLQGAIAELAAEKATFASPAFTGTPTINGSNSVSNSTLRTELNASGSAPMYACRAWVNFNGTGTVAIRASGNVSSITDSAVGDYTINFTTAMPDTNYSTVFGSMQYSGMKTFPSPIRADGTNNSACNLNNIRFVVHYIANFTGGSAPADIAEITASVFR